jgi:hypothetical protein
MIKDVFQNIPAACRESALSALVAAFDRAPIEAITPIKGGVSTASTFRVKTGGRCCLLRVEGEPSPLRNPHQYLSMRIAAEAGIAPKIHYVDESARGAVIDFIEQQPAANLSGWLRGAGKSAGRVAVARPGHAGVSFFRQLSGHRHAPVHACAQDRAFC